jgi:hypothetical protein
MDPVFILLRFLHVVLGVFWAGTIFFFAVFMFPALNDMGPDAGKVMGALQKRRYANIMPIIAGITILSGLLLYYKVSNGFDPAYMGSSHGIGYGTGGTAAILAMVIGMIMIRPAANRMGEIMQKMPAMPAGAERDALMAEVAALRKRTTTGAQVVSVLLFVAVVLMAITRYL